MRMRRRSTTLLLALTLVGAACGRSEPPPETSEDRGVALRLSNSGDMPLRCRILFGHWVERDFGELAPGGEVTIEMMQSAEDGALYIPRSDGRRLMMIENIVCARSGDWMASFGQVDLAPLRTKRPVRVTADCAIPAGSARVACVATQFEQ